jgi:hypothetical protein
VLSRYISNNIDNVTVQEAIAGMCRRWHAPYVIKTRCMRQQHCCTIQAQAQLVVQLGAQTQSTATAQGPVKFEGDTSLSKLDAWMLWLVTTATASIQGSATSTCSKQNQSVVAHSVGATVNAKPLNGLSRVTTMDSGCQLCGCSVFWHIAVNP